MNKKIKKQFGGPMTGDPNGFPGQNPSMPIGVPPPMPQPQFVNTRPPNYQQTAMTPMTRPRQQMIQGMGNQQGIHPEGTLYANPNLTPNNMMPFSPAGYADGGAVEDALRIAQRPIRPIRMHQILARHGYATDGAVEEQSEAPQSETPDYEKASQFEQQQLQSGEQQLPQMDREAYNKWKYGASEALHGMAYLHPATAPIMGAYDLGHGIATGNPKEVVGSAFGLPSRVAKAVATTAFAHDPESEGASPASRLATVAKDRFAKGGKTKSKMLIGEDDDIGNALRVADRLLDKIENEKLSDESLPLRPYGPRYNPETDEFDARDLKDIGYMGPLAVDDEGGVASEYSRDSDIGQYPLIAKDMPPEMVSQVLGSIRYGNPIPEDVDRFAEDAARQRIAEDRSPFYEPGRDEYPAWSPDQHWEKPYGMADGGQPPDQVIAKPLLRYRTQTPSSVSGGTTTPNKQHQISPEEYQKGQTRKNEYVMASGGKIHPDTKNALRLAKNR